MFQNKFQHGLIAKAIAWSMVLALIVQPLGLNAASCNCHSSNKDSATARDAEQSSCCSQQVVEPAANEATVVRTSQKNCCCSSLSKSHIPCEKMKAQPVSQCKCGDNCHCVGESSEAPVPVPLPTESSVDHNSAVVAACSWPTNYWNVGDFHLTRAADQWFADARTAQQTCSLLSRFNC